MKKALIVVVTIMLSSCFFWNASMDNVIRKYNLEYGVNPNHEYSVVDYNFFKTANGLIFSKENDLDINASYYEVDASDLEVQCTESIYTGTDESYFPHNTTQEIIRSNLIMDDGTQLWDNNSSQILNASASTLGSFNYWTSLDAVKGDYGYKYNSSTGNIDVYNIRTWLDAIAVDINIYYTTADRTAEIDITGLAEGYLGGDGIIISGNTMSLWVTENTAPFQGVVLLDIIDPSTPVYHSRHELIEVTGEELYPKLAMDGSMLHIYGYGRDADLSITDYFYYLWDVADLAAIDETDISSDMMEFLENTDPHPHTFSNGCLYIFENYTSQISLWDLTDTSAIVNIKKSLRSLYAQDSIDYSDNCFSVEDNTVYIFSANNVEIFRYTGGELSHLATGYVGVPLIGAYKFPEDPYIYALGHKSINVVSVKY